MPNDPDYRLNNDTEEKPQSATSAAEGGGTSQAKEAAEGGGTSQVRDVRSAGALFVKSLKSYFAINSFLVPQADAESDIREGVSFRGTNMLILIFAIFIASLGLNTNSTAVIIGAMLISPLMGPIIGMGLGVGINDFELIKRSGRNLLMAAGFSVLTSTIYFLISPVNESHSELLARTSPTIYDVFIAFFGGAAGIIAVGSRSKGNVLPGVAIATALMPPLCTAGYGLATWQLHYFLGATYLFIINSIYIGFATVLGVKMMRYKHKQFINVERARKVRRMVTILVVITAIPAVYLTYEMLRSNSFKMKAMQFVEQQFDFPSTKVLSYTASMNKGHRDLTVTLIGKVLPQDSLQLAMQSKLESAGLSGTALTIIQGGQPSAAAGADATSTLTGSARDIYEVAQATIDRQIGTIDSLRYEIYERARADSLGATIAPELKVLFPQVEDIAIVQPQFTAVQNDKHEDVNVALVRYSSTMTEAQREKLREYLQARLRLHRVHIVDITHQIKL